MSSISKTSYWRYLVPNSEIVDKTNNPSFKNPRVPSVTENESEFVLVKHNFSIYISIPVFMATYINTKKFVSKIFKRTISRRPDVEEALVKSVCSAHDSG